MKNLLTAFILLIVPVILTGAESVFVFDAKARSVFEKIYELRLDEARDELYTATADGISTPVTRFLQAELPFVSFLVTGNLNDKHEYFRAADVARKSIDKNQDGSVWYHYLTGRLYLQHAVLQLEAGQSAQSGLQVRKAYNSYNSALRLDDSFLPARLEKSALDVMFSSIPDEYDWLISVMGIHPDPGRAFAEIQAVISELEEDQGFEFYRIPAIVVGGYLIRNYQQSDEESLTFIRKVQTTDSSYDSPLTRFIVAKIYQSLGMNEMLLQIISTYKAEDGETHFSFLYQLRGESRLRKLDAAAESDFKLFLAFYEGDDLRKETYKLLAWSAFVAGDTAKAEDFYSQVLIKGNDRFEADKVALREAESQNLPNIHLLRVRLLYDGGYYDEALRELLSKTPGVVCRGKDEQVEYFYRLARIYEKQGKQKKALQFYDMVIDMGSEMEAYYSGNSAYLAGYICERQGRYDDAEEYYRTCLVLPFREYRKSIQQRAKAGLKRLP